MTKQEWMTRSRLELSVRSSSTRCLTLVVLPFESRCWFALAFSSLILFLQCLALCVCLYSRKHFLSDWLSVTSLFSFFGLFFFAFTSLVLSHSCHFFAPGHCVNVHGVSVCRHVRASARPHESSD